MVEVNADELEARIHERTNASRTERGTSAVALDPDLARIARYHSRRMADAGQLFHEASDGETMADRFEKLDYNHREKASGQSFCHGCGGDLRPISHCTVPSAGQNCAPMGRRAEPLARTLHTSSTRRRARRPPSMRWRRRSWRGGSTRPSTGRTSSTTGSNGRGSASRSRTAPPSQSTSRRTSRFLLTHLRIHAETRS